MNARGSLQSVRADDIYLVDRMISVPTQISARAQGIWMTANADVFVDLAGRHSDASHALSGMVQSVTDIQQSPDLAALYSLAGNSGALCTLVGIEGSFSRRLGAQIAVGWDGRVAGSLSDGCLERQLISEAMVARDAGESFIVRFGSGSPYLDFRLPCGSGLDILVDPFPDTDAICMACRQLESRHEASLALALPRGVNADLLRERAYQPALRVLLFGEGPELVAFARFAAALGTAVEVYDRRAEHGQRISLGSVPGELHADPWTAIVLLFHDHEWERAILQWAVGTAAFYIGAQGGARARSARLADLERSGVSSASLGRIRSPIGLIPRARDPEVLALSVLSEVVAAHAQLHPHA